MIEPTLAIHKKVATPDQCLKVNFGKVGKINCRFFVYDTSDPRRVLEDDEPGKHQCRNDDFDSENLKDKDRFEGFADYIYWIEDKVPKPKEKT